MFGSSVAASPRQVRHSVLVFAPVLFKAYCLRFYDSNDFLPSSSDLLPAEGDIVLLCVVKLLPVCLCTAKCCKSACESERLDSPSSL